MRAVPPTAPRPGAPHRPPPPARPPQLRHPNILSYKDSLEVPERGGVTLYLVTEPVKPLSMVLSELSLSGQHK
jgi:hypothetical protein